MKKILAIWLILIVLLLIPFYPYKMPSDKKGEYDQKAIRVKITEVFNADYLIVGGEEAIQDIFAYEIFEMETDRVIAYGNLPSQKAIDTWLAGKEIVLFGSVVGKTEITSGSGFVVNYKVDKWESVEYISLLEAYQGLGLYLLIFMVVVIMIAMIPTTFIAIKKRQQKR